MSGQSDQEVFCVEITQQGQVFYVTLARPHVRNAFNARLIATLTQIFLDVSSNPGVRVVVLRAQGSAFCAGADLNWMKEMSNFDEAQNLEDARALARLLEVVDNCPKMVVAQVQGDCFAGGIGLLAVCDMVFAVPNAKFALTEVRLGLIPATIAPYVARAIGMRALRRYALSGEMFTADVALSFGLVHELVDENQLEIQVNAFCELMFKNSPDAVGKCKALLQVVGMAKIDEALRQYTAECIAYQRASSEGKEGIAAFLEKRKPSWSSKQ